MQEHEELVWLAGNHKLDVTEYSKQLYGGEGVDDDDGGGDGGGGGGGGSESTPSYQPRKRRF